MKTRIINVGKKNNAFQHIVVLKENRYKRYSYKEIFIEGVHNIKAALKFGWKVKHWVYADRQLSSWAKEMLANIKTELNYCFSEELINEISDRTDKSELMAIFEMKEMTVQPSEKPFIIFFDRPSKKGNLGTVMRSADAFGCDGIIVTGHSVDMYDPEVIGASMGSFFAVQTERIDDNESIIQRISDLKKEYPDLKIVATTEDGSISIRDCNFSVPLILLLGNETSGLSRFFLELCDETVKIPMVGEATSFNVANAASIFLYEIFSQRQKT
jgi:TrmH family RNA methyltransferase